MWSVVANGKRWQQEAWPCLKHAVFIYKTLAAMVEKEKCNQPEQMLQMLRYSKDLRLFSLCMCPQSKLEAKIKKKSFSFQSFSFGFFFI